MLIIIIFMFLSSLIYKFYHFHTYWERNGIKGPNLWTSLMSYTKVLAQNDYELWKRYGNIIGFYEIFKRGLIINDPKLIKDILVKDFDNFTNRRYYYFGDVFDSGIVLAKDEDWKRIRSVVSQAFTSSKLKSMLTTIVKIGAQFCVNIENEALKGEFDIKIFINAFVMDVLCSCGFGIDVQSIKNPKHPIVLNARNIFEMDLNIHKILGYVWPKLAKLLRIQAIDSKSVNFFRIISKDLIFQRSREENQRKDLMQLLIDANRELLDNNLITDERKLVDRPLTLDEITATAMVIFIGGYDTTAATLSHLCYYLAKHEEYQQILFEELSRIEFLREDSLIGCKYLNAVIRETLRISPVGQRFDREASEDYMLSDTGIVIPKGCLVTFSTYTLHHDSNLFPNPFEFNPNRFLGKTSQFDESSYLGWGLGPRMCVGMNFALNEMRIFIYSLFIKYKLSLSQNYQLDYPKGNLLYIPRHVFVIAEKR